MSLSSRPHTLREKQPSPSRVCLLPTLPKRVVGKFYGASLNQPWLGNPTRSTWVAQLMANILFHLTHFNANFTQKSFANVQFTPFPITYTTFKLKSPKKQTPKSNFFTKVFWHTPKENYSGRHTRTLLNFFRLFYLKIFKFQIFFKCHHVVMGAQNMWAMFTIGGHPPVYQYGCGG